MAAALVELGRTQKDLLNDEPAWLRLSQVKAELERSMRSIRDIALLLRPSMLDDLGLIPAPRWQVREAARQSGLHIRIEANEGGPSMQDAYRT